MIGVSITKDFITLHNMHGVKLGVNLIGGYYHVHSVVRGNMENYDTTHIPRKMIVILHVSDKEKPFLEVRHVAHPLPVVLSYRRLCQRGFSLPALLTRLEHELDFAELANTTRDAGPNTASYKETWRSLYSLVHQNGKYATDTEAALPIRSTPMRKRLLTVISAYKQMAVPIKMLNTIEEKLAVIDRMEKTFMDDYEFYACLRTYIIDQVGYRLFIETCELEKFNVPLRVRKRQTLVDSISRMTTSISTLRDHSAISEKIGQALKHCFRIHNFN